MGCKEAEQGQKTRKDNGMSPFSEDSGEATSVFLLMSGAPHSQISWQSSWTLAEALDVLGFFF